MSDFAPRPWAPTADYYIAAGHDIRDVIEAFGLNYNRGAILKYMARAGRKPGNGALLDLLKAREHINREIACLEAANTGCGFPGCAGGPQSCGVPECRWRRPAASGGDDPVRERAVMSCETCKGKRGKVAGPWWNPQWLPCPGCNGTGAQSCCEGMCGGPAEATNRARQEEKVEGAT